MKWGSANGMGVLGTGLCVNHAPEVPVSDPKNSSPNGTQRTD